MVSVRTSRRCLVRVSTLLGKEGGFLHLKGSLVFSTGCVLGEGGHPWGQFITLLLFTWGNPRGHLHFLSNGGHQRGHFIMFCPLEGHPSIVHWGHLRSITFCLLVWPRGHFIMLYLPLGHPRGHFCCVFKHGVTMWLASGKKKHFGQRKLFYPSVTADFFPVLTQGHDLVAKAKHKHNEVVALWIARYVNLTTSPHYGNRKRKPAFWILNPNRNCKCIVHAQVVKQCLFTPGASCLSMHLSNRHALLKFEDNGLCW